MLHQYSVLLNINPLYFFRLTLYTLIKRSSLKYKFFRFSSSCIKIRQIPHVNFGLTSQFLLRFGIILLCHGTKIPGKFSVHIFTTLDKRNFKHAVMKIYDNSWCHFWKHRSDFVQMLHRYLVLPNITPL